MTLFPTNRKLIFPRFHLWFWAVMGYLVWPGWGSNPESAGPIVDTLNPQFQWCGSSESLGIINTSSSSPETDLVILTALTAQLKQLLYLPLGPFRDSVEDIWLTKSWANLIFHQRSSTGTVYLTDFFGGANLNKSWGLRGKLCTSFSSSLRSKNPWITQEN